MLRAVTHAEFVTEKEIALAKRTTAAIQCLIDEGRSCSFYSFSLTTCTDYLYFDIPVTIPVNIISFSPARHELYPGRIKLCGCLVESRR